MTGLSGIADIKAVATVIRGAKSDVLTSSTEITIDESKVKVLKAKEKDKNQSYKQVPPAAGYDI